MRILSINLAGALILAAFFGSALSGDEKKADEPKNLLENGSFEEGPDPGDFKPLDEDSTDIKGWTVTRGQIDYIGTHWQSADGSRSIDLHGSPGFGGVKQTFKTKKGQKYKVTFSLAGNPGGGVPEKKLGVKAAGKKESFTFDTTGKTATDMGWETKTWEFEAVDTETTLELYTLMTECNVSGPAIDNVSVVEVGK
jgi:choice-of-anchor C domain-containing protein